MKRSALFNLTAHDTKKSNKSKYQDHPVQQAGNLYKSDQTSN